MPGNTRHACMVMCKRCAQQHACHSPTDEAALLCCRQGQVLEPCFNMSTTKSLVSYTYTISTYSLSS